MIRTVDYVTAVGPEVRGLLRDCDMLEQVAAELGIRMGAMAS